MRVISQSGTMDFPYENGTVFFSEAEGRNTIKIKISGDDAFGVLGEYSTREKALKAMEMLREAYNNNEFYHCTATTNTFQEAMGILSSEKFKKATSEYFQFPQDDEIEV